MITYNTQLKPLKLPEYGRNIQRMVDHCLTIEDREQRNLCARTIINSMGNLFPQLRDSNDNMQKLWDHLAIMADFKLDVDYPCIPPQPDKFNTLPEPVPYVSNHMRYRHYGVSLQHMVEQAAKMEESEERTELIRLLANQMKKSLLAVNQDGADDAKVFADMREISHGAINIAPDSMHLHEFTAAPQPSGKKKRKKQF